MGKNLAFTCTESFVQLWQWKVALILFYLYSNKSKLQIDLSDSHIQGNGRKNKIDLEKRQAGEKELELKQGKKIVEKFLWTSGFSMSTCSY